MSICSIEVEANTYPSSVYKIRCTQIVRKSQFHGSRRIGAGDVDCFARSAPEPAFAFRLLYPAGVEEIDACCMPLGYGLSSIQQPEPKSHAIFLGGVHPRRLGLKMVQ
jgi:hypothetical protein